MPDHLPDHSYERLLATPVLETVDRLRQRIAIRFPDRDLGQVAAELHTLVAEIADVAPEHRARLRLARIVSRVLVVLIVAGTVVALALAAGAAGDVEDGLDWLALVETTVNDLVFAAIAVFFCYSVPERLQRGRLLDLLHRLRSVAHIVDMHQLTKDPERLRPGYVGTGVGQPLDLDRHQLERYLDYCAELFSLIAKAAALCAEESRDAVVLDTVSTIETLTTSMSREVWQKIEVLGRHPEH
jgi:hypothetical protein